MRALLCAVLAMAGAGCLRSTWFHCTADSDCTKSGTAGTCQPDTMFCSFADTSCDLGQRYGDLAGPLSGQCVQPAPPPDAPPDTPPGYFTVGGMVTGLAGTGLVLRDNGGDDLAVSANGAFTFATALMMGQTYDVTVGTQPSAGTCTIARGTGTIASADVTDVMATCNSGGDPGIFCGGSTYCTVTSQVCCNPQSTPSCTMPGACGGSKMTCDDAADCPANNPVCCSRVNGGGTWQSAQCQTTCNAPNATMCDPSVANTCGALTCKPFAKLPAGYYACQ